MPLKKHIPNTLTLCNLLAGCAGIVFVLRGSFSAVLVCLLISVTCDFCDGFAARKLNAYSAIGKELDSLSDLVSFGLVPSFCLYYLYGSAHPDIPLVRFLPFTLAAASALRLAKFNTDTRQTSSFLGLATTGCALLLIPLSVYSFYSREFIHDLMGSVWFIPLLAVLFSWLLVSEVPMFSLKKMTGQVKAFLVGSLVLAAACLIREIRQPWYLFVSLSLFLIVVFYLVLNLASLRRK